MTSIFGSDGRRPDSTRFSPRVLRIKASATLFPSVRQVDCGWNVDGENTLWRWVHVVLRILISLQSLFVSSGFKHLCFPPSKGLDASTSGARDFPGRACRLDPTSIWRGCSKSPRWVGGTWWDIEFYQAMCLIVFWVKTKQHPDICHKTHEKLLQSVVIITVIFVGMGKKGQGWHRVTYSTYRYI